MILLFRSYNLLTLFKRARVRTPYSTVIDIVVAICAVVWFICIFGVFFFVTLPRSLSASYNIWVWSYQKCRHKDTKRRSIHRSLSTYIFLKINLNKRNEKWEKKNICDFNAHLQLPHPNFIALSWGLPCKMKQKYLQQIAIQKRIGMCERAWCALVIVSLFAVLIFNRLQSVLSMSAHFANRKSD